jgi:cell division control protein 24
MEVVPPSYNLPRTPSTTVPGRFTQYMSGMAHFHNHNHNQSQNSMSYSQASSLRSSDSTNATSSSTLFNPPPPLPSSTPSNIGTPMNGPQESVLNRRGDKEASLFQICLNLRMRLRGLPGFDQALQEEEDDAGLDADPVTILWRFFRRGYPLMELYNSLEPRTPLEVDPTKVGEKKRGQAATFKFIQACMKELNINECFMILDLYGDDTTGFVKVRTRLDPLHPSLRLRANFFGSHTDKILSFFFL